VDPSSGEPTSPRDVAAGYVHNLACILCETISINEHNIRDPGKEHLATLLIQKFHQRYKFSGPYNNENLR
jgi:hypothetical protein